MLGTWKPLRYVGIWSSRSGRIETYSGSHVQVQSRNHLGGYDLPCVFYQNLRIRHDPTVTNPLVKHGYVGRSVLIALSIQDVVAHGKRKVYPNQ